MSAAQAAGSPASGGAGVAREAAFAALNIAAVALLVPPGSLALFFAMCLAFVWLRSALRGSLRIVAQAAGIAVLIVLLLYFKSSELLFNDTVKRWLATLAPGSQAWFAADLFAALGASYCFLRFVYALLDASITPWQFVKYYFFFPTFFSGPIMAPRQFLQQRQSFVSGNLVEGAARVLGGVVKLAAASVVETTVLGSTVERFLASMGRYPAPALWLALAAAGLWLYLNFSAFTDMAIGLSRMFGIRAPENFNKPYAALSITDFWRRWHITLGDWLRANVFNPVARRLALGGAAQPLAAAASVALTMLVCGLWHHTTWPFVAWGLMHGVGLAVHLGWQGSAPALRLRRQLGERLYSAFAWALTHGYVTLSWVFFFPVALTQFEPHWIYFKRLFGLG